MPSQSLGTPIRREISGMFNCWLSAIFSPYLAHALVCRLMSRLGTVGASITNSRFRAHSCRMGPRLRPAVYRPKSVVRNLRLLAQPASTQPVEFPI
jgi:hypothetical protein